MLGTLGNGYGQNGGGGRSIVHRLRSAQMRPSDLKPLNPSSQNNPYSQVSRDMSNPNIAIEEEKEVFQEVDNPIQKKQPSTVEVHENMNIYERLSKHVNDTKVEKDTFCRQIHLYLTMEELR